MKRAAPRSRKSKTAAVINKARDCDGDTAV
jgi:hypothetical protein